jgi:ABC-type ATPase involved in cell division
VTTVGLLQRRPTYELRALEVTVVQQDKSRKLKWLLKPFIPRGMITVVTGHSGIGKSTFIIDLIARIKHFPDSRLLIEHLLGSILHLLQNVRHSLLQEAILIREHPDTMTRSRPKERWIVSSLCVPKTISEFIK